MTRLLLASASASRQALLRAAGVDFAISPADINEPALMQDLIAKGSDAGTVAQMLAEQKAIMVSRRSPGQIVLGGDSVLALGAEIIGKSHNLAALRALLLRLSGKTHELVSAAVLAREGATLWRHTARARMTMRVLGEAFVDTYLAEEGEKLLGAVCGYHFEG